MGNSIKPHVDNAQKTGVCSLKGMKLKELPPEMSRLPKTLRTLDLSENLLHHLPSLIGQFVMLKSLSTDRNRLETLPGNLDQLIKLEALSLSYNSLRTFSLPSASHLKHLKTVNLSANKIDEFPACLCDLPNVDAVDMSSNRMTSLPSDVERLKAIELNLNRNKLSDLPSEMSKCSRLKVLRVEENCLALHSFAGALLESSQVCVLAFEGNLFTMKEFQEVEGYDEYIQRYTASKKKFV